MVKIVKWLVFVIFGFGSIAEEAERENLIYRGGQNG